MTEYAIAIRFRRGYRAGWPRSVAPLPRGYRHAIGRRGGMARAPVPDGPGSDQQRPETADDPGQKLLRALAEHGFVIDSSVVQGMVRQDEHVQLDFTVAPQGRRHWQVSADVAVADGLRLIREGACRGLQADTVAEQVGLSRSTLDVRFKQSIGRTVDQEIRRVRLARAKELLARTDLPVREVAREAGFANDQYLSFVLRQDEYCTPSEYRRTHRAQIL